MKIIKQEKASMFDPEIVDVLEENLSTFKQIRVSIETLEEGGHSKIER